MNGDSEDYRLFKLNTLLGVLDFHKHPDHFSPRFSQPLEHLVYTDLGGNGIDFQFNWVKSTVTVIFNRTFSKSWNSFDDLLLEISDCINQWMLDPTNQPISLQPVKPKRVIKASEIVKDIRAGTPGEVVLDKYGLHQSALDKILVDIGRHGLLRQDEITAFRSSVAEIYVKQYLCLECKQLQFAKLSACPHCGGEMRGLKRKNGGNGNGSLNEAVK